MRRSAVCFLACLVPACLAPALSAKAELAPHRALYELSLYHTSANSPVANAAGDLTYEIEDVCAGWATLTEFRIQLLYEDGLEGRYGTSTTAWESKDGLAFRFFIKERSTFSASYDIQGEARLDGVGQGGSVQFVAPEIRSLPLPAGTTFPIRHAVEITQAAVAGEDLVYGTLFDGAEETGLYEISAAIGPQQPPDDAKAAALPAGEPLMRGQPSWPVRLAYFDLEDELGAAMQEISIRLYANGVITDQFFDFSNFTLRARLVALEPRPKPDC